MLVNTLRRIGPRLAWMNDATLRLMAVAGPALMRDVMTPLLFGPDFLAAQLGAVAVDDRLGVPAAVPPLTVVVDYSAPNVAKEMHVGHLRSTVIGDSLVRLFEFLGHDVVRENHIGDWGRPFGMLIEHLLDLGEDVRYQLRDARSKGGVACRMWAMTDGPGPSFSVGIAHPDAYDILFGCTYCPRISKTKTSPCFPCNFF